MSNYRNALEKYLSTLDIHYDRVADVGGGSNPVKGRVHTWDVRDYDIWDNGLEEGKKDWPHDFNKSLDGEDDELRPYDIVFCLELMEYIYNPEQCVVNLNYLTVPGGILYITFPFIYPVHEPKEADSLRYTADAIAKLLGEQEFKILQIIPRTMTEKGFELYKEFMKAEGMHASKNSRHDVLGWIVKAQKNGN